MAYVTCVVLSQVLLVHISCTLMVQSYTSMHRQNAHTRAAALPATAVAAHGTAGSADAAGDAAAVQQVSQAVAVGDVLQGGVWLLLVSCWHAQVTHPGWLLLTLAQVRWDQIIITTCGAGCCCRHSDCAAEVICFS